MRRLSATRLLAISCLCLFGCIERTPDFYLSVDNSTESSVILALGYKYPEDSVCVHIEREVNAKEVCVLTNGVGKYESWITMYDAYGHTFISVYLFDGKIINPAFTNIPDYRDYNELKLLARYDLLLEDLEMLGWKVSYPPSLEMKDVHMFPSFSVLSNSHMSL